MRTLVFLTILAAAAVAWQASASAYDRPYCMEVAYGGGGSTIDCSYETFAQCLKWKVDISSTCYKNPRWQPQRKRR